MSWRGFLPNFFVFIRHVLENVNNDVIHSPLARPSKF
jgi:hypothetical protein